MRRKSQCTPNERSLGHDPERHWADIEFAEGDVYRHCEVPQRVYEEITREIDHRRDELRD